MSHDEYQPSWRRRRDFLSSPRNSTATDSADGENVTMLWISLAASRLKTELWVPSRVATPSSPCVAASQSARRYGTFKLIGGRLMGCHHHIQSDHPIGSVQFSWQQKSVHFDFGTLHVLSFSNNFLGESDRDSMPSQHVIHVSSRLMWLPRPPCRQLLCTSHRSTMTTEAPDAQLQWVRHCGNTAEGLGQFRSPPVP